MLLFKTFIITENEGIHNGENKRSVGELAREARANKLIPGLF